MSLRTQDEAWEAARLAGLEEIRALPMDMQTYVTEGADRIYVLESGRIAQSGTYSELLAAPGPFADLAKRQLI